VIHSVITQLSFPKAALTHHTNVRIENVMHTHTHTHTHTLLFIYLFIGKTWVTCT